MDTKLITQHGWLPYTLASLTLSEAYNAIGGDSQSTVPFIIWLLENPASPLALPGKITLHNHDCIHLLLGRGFSLEDEAFVIGFTMGNDTKTKNFHLILFQLFSMYFYPKEARFNYECYQSFYTGFVYGKNLPVKNLNQFDWHQLYHKKIAEIRADMGINRMSN